MTKRAKAIKIASNEARLYFDGLCIIRQTSFATQGCHLYGKGRRADLAAIRWNIYPLHAELHIQFDLLEPDHKKDWLQIHAHKDARQKLELWLWALDQHLRGNTIDDNLF